MLLVLLVYYIVIVSISSSYIQSLILCSICPDIDECAAETDDCSQTCTNNDGSFICGCNGGYILDIDGFTCLGKQKLYIAFSHTYEHKYVAGFH